MAHLNYVIGSADQWERDWPKPYVFSRLIRKIANAIKKFWSGAKKAVWVLCCAVLRVTCWNSNGTSELDDLEVGEVKGQEEGTLSYPTPHVRANAAKDLFYTSLEQKLGKGDLVKEIMADVNNWHNGR